MLELVAGLALIVAACGGASDGASDRDLPGTTTTTFRAARPANADVVNMPSLSGRLEVPPRWKRYQNEESFANADAEADARYERFAPYADQLVYELQLQPNLGIGWSVGLDGWGALTVSVATPEQEALAREILGDEVEIREGTVVTPGS